MIIPFRFILVALPFLYWSKSAGQFSGPNASTYNPNTNKYYISNYYGKNIVSLDALGGKATFISGLTAPNNILYADLPGLSGFLVLDSNYVKGYDASGAFFASYTTTGAIKLQDVVYDTSIKALFISDVERGAIYKTTFGGPPFYLPSTSIFSMPYRRPSGMIVQKQKNRILYVEDTTGGNLMALDLNSGVTSLVKALNIDNLIGLAEDGQGNLYFSSQGAKAIYQLNKYYAGSPRKLYNEPKPGDLLVNPAKDQWVYTCIICGTVFTPPLHLFGPGLEITGCKGDSFTCYKNYLHNNIGTFDSGNYFLMELSDQNGSFSNPLKLTEYSDTLIPDSMMATIPLNRNPGNYKLRWKSTKPVVTGSFELFTISPEPLFSISVSDTVQGCMNSVLELGTGNPTDYVYDWSPSNEVDSSFKPVVKHTVTNNIRLYLKATNPDGCSAIDSAYILPVNNPDPGNMADTLHGCTNTTVQLGTTAAGGLQYFWSPGHLLDDSSIAQPHYSGDTSAAFSLTVMANGGCTGTAKQYVVVNPTPDFTLWKDTVFVCPSGNAMNYIIPSGTGYSHKWIGPLSSDTSYGDTINLWYMTAGMRAIYTDNNTSCSSEKLWTVLKLPQKSPQFMISGTRLKLSDTLTEIQWYRNDTLIFQDSTEITASKTGQYHVCGTYSYGCYECSESTLIQISGMSHNQQPECSLYPVPANDLIFLNCSLNPESMEWIVRDISGKYLKNGRGNQIDISSFKEGIYILEISGKETQRFIKTTK